MAEKSKIEWTDHTFNPWMGCTAVSPACDNCYAEALVDKRFGHAQWGPHGNRRRTKTWGEPIRWNKKAEAEGIRARVFCASLADVFDNHRSILPEWRRDLWALIEATPWLDWLLLTKRPQNVMRFVPAKWREIGFPDNVWIGTTVENQTEADRRIPQLLKIPARVRFLSCEPLLGPVTLTPIAPDPSTGFFAYDILRGREDEIGQLSGPTIDWVICGGESGPKARPMHPDWARSLRDQCTDAGVAFHFKQWGEWMPDPHDEKFHPGAERLNRVGKKTAGRLLDGRTWDEVPG